MIRKPRVMILPSPTSTGSIGSMTKSIGIARELVARDCEVCFVIGGELGEFIQKEGFTVYDYPIPKPIGDVRIINSTVEFIEWSGMAEESFVTASVQAEVDAMKLFKPDVVFAEARPSASISTKILGIPSVMIASWPCNPNHPNNALGNGRMIQPFNELLAKHNLPLIENVVELFYTRADIKLAPTIPELEPEMQDIEGIEFAGYILDTESTDEELPDWYADWENDDPQIFIYLSVSALSPEVYIQTVIDTFKDKPYRVVCGCGFHYRLPELPDNLGNIKFERYVPAGPVMRDSSLAIFHGGQDTTLTTLLNGVPSITVPGKHFERDYNATMLEKLGVSKKLPIISFRPSRLLAVVEEMLQGPYGEMSRQYQKKLQQYGGTKYCVDVLVNLAKEKGRIIK